MRKITGCILYFLAAVTYYPRENEIHSFVSIASVMASEVLDVNAPKVISKLW
jgi:hypothetical protein